MYVELAVYRMVIACWVGWRWVIVVYALAAAVLVAGLVVVVLLVRTAV